MTKIVVVFFIFCSVFFASEADEIIKKLDNNMRGKNVSMKLTMKHDRTMKMQSWSEGTKKSFTKILYPPKDKGITFLSLDN